MKKRQAFTLIELLTVIAIIGILAGILIPTVASVRERAKATECTANLRNLGLAFQLYANDHNGRIPPSWHSAALRREENWPLQIRAYLHEAPVANLETWNRVFDQNFRCPTDAKKGADRFSYGLNVYLEVDPLYDDYPGAPQRWNYLDLLPNPSDTILLGETLPTSYGDHFMAHDWTTLEGASHAIDHDRHQGKANYLFTDASVRRLSLPETFNPETKTNLWHPNR